GKRHMDEPELVTELIREERPLQEVEAERRTAILNNQSGEWTKFLLLLIVIGAILFIVWVLNPIIFGRVVPSVLGLDNPQETIVLPESEPSNDNEVTTGQEDISVEPVFIDAEESDTGSVEEGLEPELTTEDVVNESAVDTDSPPAEDIIYTVQPGDTIISISETYDVSPVVLSTYNQLVNPNNIQAGTQIRIPADSGE
ncbi:MAG: LysM domain-containing protein, partial [Chloroflexota bacterium]